MTIVYLDTDRFTAEALKRFADILRDKLDDEVLFLPKDITVISNCSAEQLKQIRKMLDAAIASKEAE
jgi:hypothetical protein